MVWKRWSVLCVSVVGVGVVAVYLHGRPSRANAKSAIDQRRVQSSSGNGALEAEIKRLRREMEGLQAQVAAAPAVQMGLPPSRAPDGGGQAVEADRPSDTPEQVQKVVQERFAELTTNFREQAPNSDWASQKQFELTERFADASLAQVQDIECRAAMCRVEVEHASEEVASEFLEKNELEAGFLGSRVTRLRVEGDRYVYFVRPRASPTPQ